MPKYRQIAHKLRIQGRDPETSERPREKRSGKYLDADNPTLIELGPEDPVDLEGLLRQGAIVPYEAPKAKAEPKKDGDGG